MPLFDSVVTFAPTITAAAIGASTSKFQKPIVIPFDGYRELFLEFAGERTNIFAFSADGKQLVVARTKPTQDIVTFTDVQ